MQEEITLEIFDRLLTDFKKAIKRVLQLRPISRNKSKINEYILTIGKSYNDLIEFVENLDISDKASIPNLTKQIEWCKAKLQCCGTKLNYSFDLPEGQKLLSYPVLSDSDDFSDAVDEHKSRIKHTSSDPDILNTSCINSIEFKTTSNPNLNYSTIEDIIKCETSQHKMATSAADKRTFIGMCASIIRNNYEGDPLELDSFIDKIVLIEEVTDEGLLPTLLRFILSKLSGKARESIPDNVTSIEVLKSSLRERIRPDNSKVVAGKITALQVINNNYTEFAKRIEELADALERSLVVEGITKIKAHEMAVEQTVQTCRSNTNSDLVKSILSSSKFIDPKDVVAKLIVEQANETKEKQVLRIGNYNRQNANNNRRDFNLNNSYNNYPSRYNNNFNNNRSDNRYNGNNFRNKRNNNRYDDDNTFNNNRNGNNSDYFHNNRNNQNRNYSQNFYNNRNNNGQGNNQNNRNNHYNRPQQQSNNNNNTSVVRTLNAESHQVVVQEPSQN